MSKTLIVIVGLIVVGVALYTFIGKNNNVTTPPSPSVLPQASADPVIVDSLKQGGSSYSDPNGVYVFLYPSEYKLDNQNEGQVTRIYKTGPTQKGQTEIYDGVIVTFETNETNGKTLEQWTDDYIKTMTADGTNELIKERQKTEVNGFPAYSFTVHGFGEHEYFVTQKDGNSKYVLVTTSSVSDPGNLGFQNEVNSILATLELLK